MKRLLLDTNIYGVLLLESNLDIIKKELLSTYIVHGFTIIRKELRNTSPSLVYQGKNLRINLLQIYDDIIRKSYELNLEISNLADFYFRLYKELNGAKGYDEMHNDFLIVACAAVYGIDIVVSADKASLLSSQALRAYSLVNDISKKRNPKFVTYEEFKRWFV